MSSGELQPKCENVNSKFVPLNVTSVLKVEKLALEKGGHTPLRVFCAKSAESIEGMGDSDSGDAKKCVRV